jgi:hypothetical protein
MARAESPARREQDARHPGSNHAATLASALVRGLAQYAVSVRGLAQYAVADTVPSLLRACVLTRGLAQYAMSIRGLAQ